MIQPGQMLTSQTAHPPVMRVICRYPFDAPEAAPRWVVEPINQPTHTAEIVREADLKSYSAMTTFPLQAALDGTEVAS